MLREAGETVYGRRGLRKDAKSVGNQSSSQGHSRYCDSLSMNSVPGVMQFESKCLKWAPIWTQTTQTTHRKHPNQHEAAGSGMRPCDTCTSKKKKKKEKEKKKKKSAGVGRSS